MDAKKEKRARGSGSIFQNGSATWWIQFYERGMARRESSGSTDREDAEKLLKRRLAEVETDTFVPRQNIKIDELVADVIAEYKQLNQKSIIDVERRWEKHLKPFFGRMKACDIGTDRVRRYSEMRRAKGASPASINRELAILKRSFYLGYESTPPKVKLVPYIPMQAENNVRKGFLQDHEYAKLAAECAKEGLWLRALLATAYNFGWRIGELLGLRVRQIDLAARTIRLEVGTTKNNQGRTVKMTQEVLTLLTACVVGKEKDDHVFTRAENKPVREFRGIWRACCVRAGVAKYVCCDCGLTVTGKKCECGSCNRKYQGLIVHDLRRSGARNLRRLSVGETVIMKIGGWKTRSVFQRYDITDEADLADAAARLDEKRNAEQYEFRQNPAVFAPKAGSEQTMTPLASSHN